MILLPQSIMDIVSAGGGITINLKKQILLPQVMMDIAAIGRGNVVFDFS